ALPVIGWLMCTHFARSLPIFKVAVVPPFIILYTGRDGKASGETKAMGRPRKKDIVGVKFRIPVSLVGLLEESAAKRKPVQSMNAEAVSRLNKSFAEEDAFGGEDGRRLLYFIASAFIHAGKSEAGKRRVSEWIGEPRAYVAAMFGTLEAMLVAQANVSREKLDKQMKLMAELLQASVASKRRAKETVL